MKLPIGWRREPARHALAAKGVETAGGRAPGSLPHRAVAPQSGHLRNYELRFARRLGRKTGDLEEIAGNLREIAGFEDDGSGSYTQIPEGADPLLLEERLKQLVGEAERGAQEAEQKTLQRDMQKMFNSR